MTLRLRRTAWTVGETAAHLVIALRGFTDAAHDDLRRWEDRLPDVALRYRERLADFNATTVSAEPARDARGAGQAIVDAAEAFLEATAELPAGRTVPTPWYAEGTGLTVAAATRLLLGEQVIHGRDIAKAAGRKWMIDTADAELIFGRFAPCCPSLPTRRLSAASQPASTSGSGIKSPFTVRISDGRVRVDSPPHGDVDCHIVAAPVALLLVGYGRESQWSAIAGGKMFTWGRKPWLAFRFVGLFYNP